MSDFLSPAINERLKEKRMEERNIYDVVNDVYAAMCIPAKGRDEAEKQLREAARIINTHFLDTIEKAKPEEQDPNAVGSFNNGYNIGVNEFTERLKKEINHE